MTDPFNARVQRALHQRAARLGPRASADDALAGIHRRARRQRRTRRAGAALATAAVLGLAAAAALPLTAGPDVVLTPGDEGATPTARPTPSPTATPTPASPTASCQGRERGVAYRVAYPASWWASDGTDAEPCRWFHPEPFDMPSEARDVPGVALTVRVADTPFEQARQLDTDPDELPDDMQPDELLAETETTVDGRRAVTQEYVSGLEGIYPRGTTFFRLLVAVGERTLMATTSDFGANDYDARTAALHRIRDELEILEVAGD